MPNAHSRHSMLPLEWHPAFRSSGEPCRAMPLWRQIRGLPEDSPQHERRHHEKSPDGRSDSGYRRVRIPGRDGTRGGGIELFDDHPKAQVRRQPMVKRCAIESLPAMFLLDRRGVLISISVRGSQLEEAVRRALKPEPRSRVERDSRIGLYLVRPALPPFDVEPYH